MEAAVIKQRNNEKSRRIVDYLLFYAGADAVWNHQVRHNLSEKELKEYKEDTDGRLYKCDNLTAPGGRRKFTWRGARPSPSRGWIRSSEELDAMLERGEIELRADGVTAKLRGWKRYLDDNPGQKLQSIWTDILRVGNTARERTMYPTQKPLALLERIISVSSNPDDVVLDPFCGCATTCIAAQRLSRKWVGIDVSPKAVELVDLRLKKDLGLFGTTAVHRTDIPVRTDQGNLPHYRTHKNELYGRQDSRCVICEHRFPIRNLTVDHITPQVMGGSDVIDNLQLLCAMCNSLKGTGTTAEAKAKLLAERKR